MSVMEGFLSKWTNVMKGWQYRWFVLDENAGILSYYTVGTYLSLHLLTYISRIRNAFIAYLQLAYLVFTRLLSFILH